MAFRRLAFRSLTVAAGFGLCLGVATNLSLQRPEPDVDHSASFQAHFGAWASSSLYRLMGTLEWLFEPGRARLVEENTNQNRNTSPAPPIDRAAALGYNISGLREALPFYKAGDLAHGDEQARAATDPIVRTTLEWIALRSARDVGSGRLQAFLDTHPSWPARDFVQRRVEESLYLNHASAAFVEDTLTRSPPQTVLGKLALARTLMSEGKNDQAGPLVRDVWRNADLGGGLEVHVKNEFGSFLTTADHKARADRLLYEQQNGAGLRAAFLAGPDVYALAKVRAAANLEAVNDKMLASVPPSMWSDPGYLFAKIQKFHQADKVKEAAALMLTAPRDLTRVVDGDAWWIERRRLAREVLDLDDPVSAYRICDEHAAQTNELKIEAEFMAGWIALRFLNDPVRAAAHFDTASHYAETPISIARIAYWQGRAAEISQRDDADTRAKAYYEKAAARVSTYYGQLARERLGWNTISLRSIGPAAAGKARDESIKVVELLYALGEKDLALSLATATAQHLKDESQLAALANVVAAERDAHASLVIGKILGQRQVPVDSLAYPTYGIPTFEPAEHSASPAVVYAIARQESAFDTRAISTAAAKGLMQMIDSTARRTAQRIGLAFDPNRLVNDAAFNAKLGAAHLGELFNEERGSPILVFAAYNAGGGRVKQWIDAHGDPRTPGVDPIDWVERIPFEETRNYVQRVMENWAMYQASFGEPKIATDKDTLLRTAAE